MLKDVTKAVKGNKTVMLVLGVVIIIVIVMVIYNIYKASKTGAAALGGLVGQQIIMQQTGIQPSRQDVCLQVAQDCRKAMTIDPIFHTVLWTTDEDVVAALNQLTSVPEAKFTSQQFRELAGISLKSVVEGGTMVENSRNKILFRNSLT